jgi:hypothetical protein
MGWRSRGSEAVAIEPTGWRSRRPVHLVSVRPVGLGAVDLKTQWNSTLQTSLAQLTPLAVSEITQIPGASSILGTAGTISSAAGSVASVAVVATGVVSAYSLITNGYDPSLPADNAKFVNAIAGGLALIPGVGIFLAGAVEVLWTVGNAIGCPVTHLFGGTSPACGDPPCVSSGNWTPGGVLSQSNLPSFTPESFGKFVTSALAVQGANVLNCKGGLTPDHIVDASVNMWNQTHAGPAIDYFVPPLSALFSPMVPFWPLGLNVPVYSQLTASAFQPVSQTSQLVQNWIASPYFVIPPQHGVFEPGQWADARIVQVNAGALLQPAAPPQATVDAFRSTMLSLKTNGIPDAQWATMDAPTQAAWRAQGFAPASEVAASAGMSTTAKVATGVAVAGVAAAAGVGIFAYMRHLSYGGAWKQILAKVKT